MGFFEIFAAVLAGLYAVVPNYGVAIILLTVAVRLIMLPLSIKQTRSMREMQRIAPEVKKIQQKYKGNRQKMNEEVMNLYKEHGVNPFGGCAPMILQLPVLFGLFYVIRSPLQYLEPLRGAALYEHLSDAGRALEINRFLGFRLDCTASASFDDQLRGSPLLPNADCGDGVLAAIPYLILILLLGFTTYYQQRQMQASRGAAESPQAQQMQMMGKIMPAMLMFFGIQFPAGVVLYWLTTNAWTIAQQRVMLGAAEPEAGGDGVAKPTAKAASKPATGKPADKAPQRQDTKPSSTSRPKAKKKRR